MQSKPGGKTVSFAQTKVIWKNGEIVEWGSATVHVSAHALHYGSGVFEGIRCYDTERGPAVFCLEAHLNRLRASAAVYDIAIPYSDEQLETGVQNVVRLNGFRDCYIRPLCYYGSESLGVHPRGCPLEVVILAWPWRAYLGEHGMENGVRVTVSSWRKFDSRMMPATAKACGQYVNSMLAVTEAVGRGYDEALLLNGSGDVAEGSGENLFIVREGRLITNDERSFILLGVTRSVVLRIARDHGIDVEVRTIRLDDLLSADEAFLTGTAAEVTPIREVDGAAIGLECPGPITRQIRETFYRASSGRDPRYYGWLRYIHGESLEEVAPAPIASGFSQSLCEESGG
jgi:branched-chain amino acid aminotransferase